MKKYNMAKFADLIVKANTGADAIKRAPIVFYDSGIRCLRIQDISQKKKFSDWGFCKVNDQDRSRFLLKKNDIVIARTGETIGCNMIIKEDLEAVYNNGLIKVLIDKNKCHPLYAYYNISSQLFSSYIDNVGRT